MGNVTYRIKSKCPKCNATAKHKIVKGKQATVIVRCESCRHKFEVKQPIIKCPRCGMKKYQASTCQFCSQVKNRDRKRNKSE